MGRRHACLVVYVRENLKSELDVLIEHLESLRDVISAMLPHEILVAEQALEPLAHLLAPARPRVACKNGATILHEFIQLVGHASPPCRFPFRCSQRPSPRFRAAPLVVPID